MPFSISEIEDARSGVSREMVQLVVRTMKTIVPAGKGRAGRAGPASTGRYNGRLMPTRFLACLLAIAIAWISLFAFEAGHEQAEESSGDAAIALVAVKDPGTVADHHLDDVPLQSMDSATDLPDHQPPSRALIAAGAAPPQAVPAHPPRYATVFLDGLLRPPGAPLFLG